MRRPKTQTSTENVPIVSHAALYANCCRRAKVKRQCCTNLWPINLLRLATKSWSCALCCGDHESQATCDDQNAKSGQANSNCSLVRARQIQVKPPLLSVWERCAIDCQNILAASTRVVLKFSEHRISKICLLRHLCSINTHGGFAALTISKVAVIW